MLSPHISQNTFHFYPPLSIHSLIPSSLAVLSFSFLLPSFFPPPFLPSFLPPFLPRPLPHNTPHLVFIHLYCPPLFSRLLRLTLHFSYLRISCICSIKRCPQAPVQSRSVRHNKHSAPVAFSAQSIRLHSARTSSCSRYENEVKLA